MPMPKAVLWAVEGFPWPDGWTPEPEWTPSGARDSGDDSDSSPSAGFFAKSAGKGPARSSEASMRAEVRDFEAQAEAQLELVESEKSCDESVDVVFIIDVTGSMSNQIEGVKQRSAAIVIYMGVRLQVMQGFASTLSLTRNIQNRYLPRTLLQALQVDW